MKKAEKQLLFVGGGRIVEHILGKIFEAKSIQKEAVTVYDHSAERCDILKNMYGISVVSDCGEIAQKPDVIIFAVPPACIGKATKDIISLVTADTGIITVCAGVSLDDLGSLLPQTGKMIRAMPNTLSDIRYGYSALCASDESSEEEKAYADRIFSSTGETIWMKEDEFPAFTAFCCSGPAYILVFASALIDAGVRIGLPRQFSRAAIIDHLYGTASLLQQSGESPVALTESMTTPAGITIEALHELYSSGFQGMVMDAVMAAFKKALED